MRKTDPDISSNFDLPDTTEPDSHKSKGIADHVYSTLLEDPNKLDELVLQHPGYCGHNLHKIKQFQSYAVARLRSDKHPWTDIPISEDTPDDIKQLCLWLNSNIKKPRKFKQPQLWLWSELPNFGKTSLTRILEHYCNVCTPIIMAGDYFSTYDDNTDLVVIDDYNHPVGTISLLNRFLQGSSGAVPIKGGSIPKVNNPPVIFTSNVPPDKIYSRKHALLEARLTVIELTRSLFPLIDLSLIHI